MCISFRGEIYFSSSSPFFTLSLSLYLFISFLLSPPGLTFANRLISASGVRERVQFRSSFFLSHFVLLFLFSSSAFLFFFNFFSYRIGYRCYFPLPLFPFSLFVLFISLCPFFSLSLHFFSFTSFSLVSPVIGLCTLASLHFFSFLSHFFFFSFLSSLFCTLLRSPHFFSAISPIIGFCVLCFLSSSSLYLSFLYFIVFFLFLPFLPNFF